MRRDEALPPGGGWVPIVLRPRDPGAALPIQADQLTPKERAILDVYRMGDLTVAEICEAFDISRGTLYRLLAKAGEPFRRAASAKPGRALERTQPIDLCVPSDEQGGDVQHRLERLLSLRVAELEVRSLPGRTADPEAAAKALAINVRTLAALRRTAASEDCHDHTDAGGGEPPRSLVALRDELYGHLQRIRDEERARREHGCVETDPDGDGGTPSSLAGLLPGEPAAAR